MDKFRPDRKPQHSTQEDSKYRLIRKKGSGFRVYWNHEDEPQKSYCLPWPYNAISSDPHCTTSGAEDSINAETCSRPIDQEAPGQSLDTPLKNRVIHSDLFSHLPPVNCIHNKMHCRKWERRMRWREKQSPFSMNILALGGILSVVLNEVREGEGLLKNET